MILSLIATASILAQSPLDSEMSIQDRKKTGIYKLTEKEKIALHAWIEGRYSKRDQPLESSAAEHGTLQEVLLSGTYVRLSNGSLWNIHPDDALITAAWITPTEIYVTLSGDSEYPYNLKNSLTGTIIRAKKADRVPNDKTP